MDTNTEFDATVEVQVSKRGGAWAFTLQPAISREVRATGKLPTKGATRHTLLAVGITASLMAIHPREWQRLRGDKPKPRIAINVPDRQFINALEFRRRSKAQPNDGFRVSRNLLRPLYEQLARFDATLRLKPQEQGKPAALLTPAERLIHYRLNFGDGVFNPALLVK